MWAVLTQTLSVTQATFCPSVSCSDAIYTGAGIRGQVSMKSLTKKSDTEFADRVACFDM